jgi:branched-chain amino acid transport system substrate-binding protein
VIGNVSTTSGPIGSSVRPAVEALQVWVRAVNSRGGINGHLVKLVTADDGADPARHRAQVQEMVQRDHVIAFIANQAPFTEAQSVDYHNQVGVPVIGGEGSGQFFYESPMHFPAFPHEVALFKLWLASPARQLVPEGKTKLATLTCQEATACEGADTTWRKYAEEVGFQLVYRARSSIAQPDYTAECLNAKSAGAEVLVISMDGNSVSRIITSCSRQGYQPTYAIPSHAANPSLLDFPDFEGAAITSQTFQWFAGDTPARAEFQKAMVRYRPGVPMAGSHSLGWTAAKLFERAAADMPEPPAAAAVLEGLWRIHGDDLGGLTYDLTFNRGQPREQRVCWYEVRVRQGRYVAPDGANHCR